MSSPATGAVRHLRAFLAAATMLSLSVTGHLAGGGSMPHPVALAVLLAVACVPAYLLARRSLGFVTLIALLGAGQYGVHVALTSQSSLHDHGAASVATHEAGRAGFVMLTAHLAATFVAAAVLAHLDSALWGIWRLLSSALRFAIPVALPALPQQKRPAPVRFAATLISRSGVRDADPRGPPMAACPTSG